MKEKHLKLKNNLTATLSTQKMDDVYIINAFSDHYIVGTCNFSIAYRYILDNPNNIPQNKTYVGKLKNKALRVSPEKLKNYKQKDGKILLGDLTFSYLETIIELNNIKITDPKFSGCGLGHSMLMELMDIAKKHKATRIEGFYYPHGELQSNAPEFYKRHGFKWQGSKIYTDIKTK